MTQIYKIALNIAKRYHINQKYGDSSYLSSHLQDVVVKTANLFCKWKCGSISIREIDLIEAIAWLHDVVEDTDCTYEIIREEMSKSKTVDAEDIDKLIEAIDAITKRKDEAREEYVYRCSQNPLALKVKIADTLCNLEASLASGESRRIAKYSEQIQKLTNIYNNLHLS